MSPHPLLAHLLYFVCVCVVGVGDVLFLKVNR